MEEPAATKVEDGRGASKRPADIGDLSEHERLACR